MRRLILLAALAAAVAGCGGDDAGSPGDGAGTAILATTTSTQDSGLLDELVPAFEQESDCQLKTVALGSGEALALGERGDADVLLVHSPAAEEALMAHGHGATREPVMHNDFVLVGPPEDPAHVRGLGAPEALERIAHRRAPFASRADESGTHAKELALWERAGVQPHGDWYVETGQGMGPTLTIASQKEAYTLSDRGTFLATESLDSSILVEGGAALRNPYTVIVPRRSQNTRCAEAFARWITDAPAQGRIRRFGVQQYGEPLFHPDA
jgi:tungstate transport system substrate-binding protein